MGIKLGDAFVLISGDRKPLQKDLRASEQETRSWASKLTGQVQTIGKGVMVAAGAVLAGTAAVGAGLLKVAIDAAPLEGIKMAFEGIATSSGQAADKLLAALRRASAGMVSARELMLSYNSAAQLVNVQFANKMPEAMQYLTKVSAATGQDMGYLIDSLVRGVGRLSPIILDNLMVQVDMNKAYQDWARINGVAVAAMSKTEKQMAVMDATLAQLRANTAAMPEVLGSASAVVGALGTRFQDLKDMVGLALLPALKEFFGLVTGFLDLVGPLLEQGAQLINAAAVAGLGAVKAFVRALARAMGIDLDAIAANAEGYGQNIVLSLARGMVSAAVAVLQALQGIGRLITGWLSPGSPPRLLPDLDKWGAAAATTYMEAWGDADFSIFDALTGTIKGYLQSLSEDVIPKDMLIPWLSTLQAGVAEGVNRLQELAEGGRETFDELLAGADFLPASLRDYARSLVDVRRATEAVEQAQSELNEVNERAVKAQEDLNRVTQKYDDMMAPLSAEMKALEDKRQAIRDEQRLAELRKVTSDESLTASERELAALEIAEIELRRKMATVEKERDVAVDAAREKLKAEEEAQRQAQEKLKAAEEAERQAEAEARRRKAVIDAQTAANRQLKEQASLLQKVADAAKGMGSAVKKSVKGLGTELKDALKEGIKVPKPDTKGLESLAKQLEDIFKPLETEAEETGTVWGGVIDTIKDKLNELLENPVVQTVLDWITKFVDLKDVLIALGIAVAVVVVPALWSLAQPLLIIMGVLAILTLAVAGVRNAWEKDFLGIRTTVETAIGGIKTFWEENGAEILSNLQSWAETTKADIQQFMDDIWIRIEPIVTKIKELIDEALKLIKKFWDDHKAEILLIVGIFFKLLETAFRTGIETAKKVVLIALDVLTGKWDLFGKDLEDLSNTLWKIIEDIWGVKLDDIKAAVEGWIEDVKSQWDTFWSDVQTTVETKIEEVKAEIQTKLDDAKTRIETFISDTLEPWETAFSDVKDTVETVVGDIKTALVGANGTGGVLGTLTSKINTFKDDVLAPWKTAFNGVKDAINFIITALQTLIGLIPQVNIPEGWIPGSPSPFERSLRGISAAMADVNAQLRTLVNLEGRLGPLVRSSVDDHSQYIDARYSRFVGVSSVPDLYEALGRAST